MSSEDSFAGAAVITFKQLGDTLLLEPALRHLRSRFSVPATLFAKPGFEPLIELMTDAHLPAESNGRFAQLWVFEPGSKAAGKALFTRAKEKQVVLLRPKYIQWYHRLIFDRIRTEKPGYHEYRARFLHREVGGADADFRPPSLNAPPETWAPQVSVPADYILLCPTAAWESKRWSAEAWGEAVEGIAVQCSLPILMVGGGSEWERVHASQIEACTCTGHYESCRAHLAARTAFPCFEGESGALHRWSSGTSGRGVRGAFNYDVRTDALRRMALDNVKIRSFVRGRLFQRSTAVAHLSASGTSGLGDWQHS